MNPRNTQIKTQKQKEYENILKEYWQQFQEAKTCLLATRKYIQRSLMKYCDTNFSRHSDSYRKYKLAQNKLENITKNLNVAYNELLMEKNA